MADSTTQYTLKQLADWYSTPLGLRFALAAKSLLQEALGRIFGYYLLQMGLPEQQHWLSSSPIRHQCIVNEECYSSVMVSSRFAELPFASDSVDCVFCPHLLEVVADEKAVLAEIHRVLTPGGYLLMLGFNPVSFWGARRWLKDGANQAPWNLRFHSVLHWRSALNSFGFTIDTIEHFFYRPPVAHQGLLQKLLFLETLGGIALPYPAAAHLLTARKQVETLQWVKPLWQTRQYSFGRRVVRGEATATQQRRRPE